MKLYKPGALLCYKEIDGYREIIIVLSYFRKFNEDYILYYQTTIFSKIILDRVRCDKVNMFVLDNYEVLHEL